MACVVLAGCRSSRNATKPKADVSQPTATTPVPPANKEQIEAEAAAYVARVAKVKLAKTCVTASAKVNIQGLGKELSVNGSLRMKRDEIIRLSLRFLGMEVGLLEFTPEGVLVVDRMNKQYVRAAYSDLSFLRQAELDFHSLQSLFWNELFVPGKENASPATKRFHLAKSGGQTLMMYADAPQLVYTFSTSTATALIEKLTVKGKKPTDKGQFCWTYGDFQPFAGRAFPTSMQMQVSGTPKNVSLALKLSSLKNDCEWATPTKLSSKYTQRGVEEILKGLKL